MSASSPASGVERWRPRQLLAFVAPALLCAVALTQLVAVGQTPLSRWKGGGFGMYSGVDSVRARWIRAVLVTPSGELPLSFDRLVDDRPGLAHVARNARSLPDANSLAAVGRGLMAAGLFADCTPTGVRGVSGHYVKLLPPRQLRTSGCRRLAVTGLVLEIWRYDYRSGGGKDPGDRRLVGEKLVAVAVEAAPPGSRATEQDGGT